MSDKDIKRRQSYDEPMGVDEAIEESKFPEAMNPFHVDHGSYVLAVEVERLREVESDVLGDNECFRKRNAELEAELQRFREREPLVEHTQALCDDLRKERDDLQSQLDVVAIKLERFEEREPLVQALLKTINDIDAVYEDIYKAGAAVRSAEVGTRFPAS